LIILLGMLAAPQPTQAQDEFPQENAWHKVTPSVVWCDDPQSTVTLEVHIVGRTDVAQVQVTNSGEDDRFTLYDDGSHGDAVAGDNVFTLEGAQLYCNPRDAEERGYDAWWGFLRVRLKNGQELENNYGMTAGMVHQDFRDIFQVEQLGEGLSATAYAFFIEDSGHEVLDDYPVAELYCGKGNYEAFRKLYSVMPDAFDFVMLMPGMQLLRPDGFPENTPYAVLVSNAVQNIGVAIKDDTALFGSSGRLLSMIYHSFGSLAIFDHEVAHTWGAGIGTSLGLADTTSSGLGHWDKMSDIAGQLGEYYFHTSGVVGRFHDNGDGTWRLVSNFEVEPYSPLELYVMGLIPPEEVPPIHILQSPDLSDLERITAASWQTVTIEQIMQAEGGPRNPSSDQSRKDFDLAFVVVQDLPYNDAAYAFFSLISYRLMTREPPMPYDSFGPFYWATGGRATLNTRLPVNLADPVGPAPLLQPEPAATETPPASEAATEAPGTIPEAEQSTPTTATGAEEVPPTQAPPAGAPRLCGQIYALVLVIPALVLVCRRRERGL
jgi:hypothetical protein